MKQALFSPHTPEKPARCAVFVSGAGSNAAKLLEFVDSGARSFAIDLLIGDNPECRGKEIAEKCGREYRLFDLKKFYAAFGEESTRLDTPRRREIRDLWSAMIEKELLDRGIEMVLLAGFVPLINFVRLPALNVHPGDLTKVDENGVRRFAGLHFKPVERAILDGEKYLRSSVIAVENFTGKSTDIDAGPVLGVSIPVGIDLAGKTLDELKTVYSQRVANKKVDDILRRVAIDNIEKLKLLGDHVIFPAAAEDFAAGCFAVDGETLFYRGQKVLSVEYSPDGEKRLM